MKGVIRLKRYWLLFMAILFTLFFCPLLLPFSLDDGSGENNEKRSNLKLPFFRKINRGWSFEFG